eukprot:scaffold252370_cov14-Tisochrysis_lutea.AAC.1
MGFNFRTVMKPHTEKSCLPVDGGDGGLAGLPALCVAAAEVAEKATVALMVGIAGARVGLRGLQQESHLHLSTACNSRHTQESNTNNSMLGTDSARVGP